MLYIIEVVCGGSDASGGGCGAPLNLFEASPERFAEIDSPAYDEPVEHRPDECWFNAEEQAVLVKVRSRPCSDCRRVEF